MKILFRTLLVLAVMAAVAAVLVQVLHMADRDTCSAPESLTPDAGRLPAEAAEMIARKGLSMPAIKGPIFNYDCTQFFTDREMLRLQSNPIEEGVDGGALVDGYVDHLAGAGVTVMMININARRTNYRSAVWESFWDGYDPNGPDDQPFLAPLPEASRTKYRQVIHSMWALDQQGVDYPARVIARCRERGISPWVSIRMNDCHYPDDLEHPFHGSMWRRGDLFRGAGGGVSGYYARCLDYAQPEVRDLYRALIEECVQRYDVDGIELDFLREPYLFKPGAEEEGAKILHKWIREIRRLTERAGAERGRPIRLGVRVPSCVETARSWGLDAVTWAREGLVDLVVPAPRWATIQFDMPLDKWREALDGTGVSLAGGLEFSYRPHRNAPFARASVEQSVGAATAVLAAGADAVYLFNIFDYPFSHGPLMRAMASIETLLALPRRHAITYREVIGRGEDYRPPLPAEGTNLNFQIFTGPQPGKKDEVTLLVTGKGSVSVPAATVNNVACKLLRRISEGGNTRLEYRVPVEALPGNRRDAITLAASEPITVLDVQIRIVTPGTAPGAGSGHG